MTIQRRITTEFCQAYFCCLSNLSEDSEIVFYSNSPSTVKCLQSATPSVQTEPSHHCFVAALGRETLLFLLGVNVMRTSNLVPLSKKLRLPTQQPKCPGWGSYLPSIHFLPNFE
eukprot:gb/GECG01014695.1/.p1 GENE.gb/GECG01014695.1/~~gb/GECG01014695.1/.p1  ORF type:complete len:114 (+),score=5.59 gb/GECG01014695.1/:1-342(+)